MLELDKEYLEIKKMNYMDLCQYLQNKYGIPNGDYFFSNDCKNRNTKIARGSDGLFLHHIKENEAIMLSTYQYAIKNPFEWQKGYNLVYCNYLEHLLLHAKIVEEYYEIGNKLMVGSGGIVNFILPEILILFNRNGSDIKWKNNAYKRISNLYKELNDAINLIENIFKNKELIFCYMSEDFFDSTIISKKLYDEIIKEYEYAFFDNGIEQVSFYNHIYNKAYKYKMYSNDNIILDDFPTIFKNLAEKDNSVNYMDSIKLLLKSNIVPNNFDLKKINNIKYIVRDYNSNEKNKMIKIMFNDDVFCSNFDNEKTIQNFITILEFIENHFKDSNLSDDNLQIINFKFKQLFENEKYGKKYAFFLVAEKSFLSEDNKWKKIKLSQEIIKIYLKKFWENDSSSIINELQKSDLNEFDKTKDFGYFSNPFNRKIDLLINSYNNFKMFDDKLYNPFTKEIIIKYVTNRYDDKKWKFQKIKKIIPVCFYKDENFIKQISITKTLKNEINKYIKKINSNT